MFLPFIIYLSAAEPNTGVILLSAKKGTVIRWDGSDMQQSLRLIYGQLLFFGFEDGRERWQGRLGDPRICSGHLSGPL